MISRKNFFPYLACGIFTMSFATRCVMGLSYQELSILRHFVNAVFDGLLFGLVPSMLTLY